MPKELLDVFPTRRDQKIADETEICNTRRATRHSSVGKLYTYCPYADKVVEYENTKRAPKPPRISYSPDPKPAKPRAKSVRRAIVAPLPVPPVPLNPVQHVPSNAIQQISLNSLQPVQLHYQPNKPKTARRKSQSVPPKSLQSKPVQPKSVQPQSVQPKPTQPKSVQPKPVQPKSVQPKAVQPKPVQPKFVQPKPVQPKSVQPQPAQQKSIQKKQPRSKSIRQTSVPPNPGSQNAVQPNPPQQNRAPRKPRQRNNSVSQRTMRLRSARQNSIPPKPLLLKSILKKSVPPNTIWTRQNASPSKPLQPKYKSVPPKTIRFKSPLLCLTPPKADMEIDSPERTPIRHTSLPPKSIQLNQHNPILQNIVRLEAPVKRLPKRPIYTQPTRFLRSLSELSFRSNISAPLRAGLKRASSCSQPLQTKRFKQQEEIVVSIGSSTNKSPRPVYFSDDELDDEVFTSTLPALAHLSINTTGLPTSNTSAGFEEVTFDDTLIKEEEPDYEYEPISVRNDDAVYEVFTINDVAHEIVVSNDCKDVKNVYHVNGIYDVDDVDDAYDINDITVNAVNDVKDFDMDDDAIDGDNLSYPCETNDVNNPSASDSNDVNDANHFNDANSVKDVNHFNVFNDVNAFNDLMDANDFDNVNYFNDSNKVNGVDTANVVNDGYDLNGFKVFHGADVSSGVNLDNDFKDMSDAQHVEDREGGNIGNVDNDAYDVSIGALYSSESALPVFANGKVAIEYDNFDFSVSCALIRNLRCFDENHEDSLIPLLKLVDREIINKLSESTVEDFYVREFVPAFDNMKKHQEEPTKFVNSNEGQFERYVEDGTVIEVPLPPKPELFPYQIDKRSKAEIVEETNKKIDSEWQEELNERQRIAEEWINQQAEIEHERFLNYHMELDQDFQRQMLNNPPLINMFPVPYPELNPNNFPFYPPQFPPIPQMPFVIPPLDPNFYNIYPQNMPPPFNPNFHL